MIDAEIYRRKEQYDPRCITKLVSNVSAKRPVIVILLVIQVTAVCRLTVCVCVCVCVCPTSVGKEGFTLKPSINGKT